MGSLAIFIIFIIFFWKITRLYNKEWFSERLVGSYCRLPKKKPKKKSIAKRKEKRKKLSFPGLQKLKKDVGLRCAPSAVTPAFPYHPCGAKRGQFAHYFGRTWTLWIPSKNGKNCEFGVGEGGTLGHRSEMGNDGLETSRDKCIMYVQNSL